MGTNGNVTALSWMWRRSRQIIIPLTCPLRSHIWVLGQRDPSGHKSNTNKLDRVEKDNWGCEDTQSTRKSQGNWPYLARGESEGMDPNNLLSAQQNRAVRDDSLRVCSDCSGSNSHKSQQVKFQLSTKEQHIQECEKHPSDAGESPSFQIQNLTRQLPEQHDLTLKTPALRHNLQNMASWLLLWCNLFNEKKKKSQNVFCFFLLVWLQRAEAESGKCLPEFL